MGIGGYSTVDALRGEIGASLVKSRIIETTLQYIRETMNSKFNNIKEMMLDTINSKSGRWFMRADHYRQELGIEWEDLYKMTKEELKRKVREYDTRKWRESLNNKSTLEFYREGKTKIGYEHCYRNNINSMFLARARMNSLKLEEAKGRGIVGYDSTCKLCKNGEENLVHFIAECPALEGKRKMELFNSNSTNPKQMTIDLLFNQNRYQEVGRMIEEMWYRRRSILKTEDDIHRNSPDPGGTDQTPRIGRRHGFPIQRRQRLRR